MYEIEGNNIYIRQGSTSIKIEGDGSIEIESDNISINIDKGENNVC